MSFMVLMTKPAMKWGAVAKTFRSFTSTYSDNQNINLRSGVTYLLLGAGLSLL